MNCTSIHVSSVEGGLAAHANPTSYVKTNPNSQHIHLLLVRRKHSNVVVDM